MARSGAGARSGGGAFCGSAARCGRGIIGSERGGSERGMRGGTGSARGSSRGSGRPPIGSGAKPDSMPVMTLPGVLVPGRPPSDAYHASQSHATMAPSAPTPTR